jgi:hypothetical protein
MGVTEAGRRLEACARAAVPWKKWGPYLSERQWGTVREDYSPGGDAWDHFTHDQARSRAYRWGEDGLGGLCDHKQRLCFGLALWNGKDPILKERLYGLTNGEGNHGEDVKVGASHQTGWTGAVAKLIQLFGYLTPQDILQGGSTLPIMWTTGPPEP